MAEHGNKRKDGKEHNRSSNKRSKGDKKKVLLAPGTISFLVSI